MKRPFLSETVNSMLTRGTSSVMRVLSSWSKLVVLWAFSFFNRAFKANEMGRRAAIERHCILMEGCQYRISLLSPANVLLKQHFWKPNSILEATGRRP